MNNPLTEKQQSLLDLRKAIIAQVPGITFEVKDAYIKADYTRIGVQATRADGTKTSVCQGYVYSTDDQMNDLVSAEIVGLIFCCAELGVEIDISGEPVLPKPEPVKPGNPDFVWSYEAVKNMEGGTDMVLQVMHSMNNPNVDDVMLWMAEKKRLKQRTHPKHIADYLIKLGEFKGKKSVAEKRTSAPQPNEEKVVVPRPKALREPKEAQQYVNALVEKGVTLADIQSRFPSKYSSIAAFCMFAEMHEIQSLCE